MTILCHGDTHVFQSGSTACDCGLYPSGYPQGLWPASIPRLTKPYPLSGGVIPGYTPNSFAPQRPPTPPTAGEEACDVPLRVLKAAQDVHATHLSADGQRVYIQMSDGVRVCYWDEETKVYGSSFPCPDGLPADAVAM